MSEYGNIITDEFTDGDGEHVRRAILPVPGHDVQVIHAGQRDSFTVKVDSKAAEVESAGVIAWILRALLGGE